MSPIFYGCEEDTLCSQQRRQGIPGAQIPFPVPTAPCIVSISRPCQQRCQSHSLLKTREPYLTQDPRWAILRPPRDLSCTLERELWAPRGQRHGPPSRGSGNVHSDSPLSLRHLCQVKQSSWHHPDLSACFILVVVELLGLPGLEQDVANRLLLRFISLSSKLPSPTTATLFTSQNGGGGPSPPPDIWHSSVEGFSFPILISAFVTLYCVPVASYFPLPLESWLPLSVWQSQPFCLRILAGSVLSDTHPLCALWTSGHGSRAWRWRPKFSFMQHWMLHVSEKPCYWKPRQGFKGKSFIWDRPHETLGRPGGLDREGKASRQVCHRAGYHCRQLELNDVGKLEGGQGMPIHQDDPPLERGKGGIYTPIPISHCLRLAGGGIKSPDSSRLPCRAVLRLP